MDRRSLHNKRKKNSSRTHERLNQGILDKVASKVKGFLNPWLSMWNSVTEEDTSSSSDNEDAPQEREHVPQITLQSGKRPRLQLSDHSLPGCSSNSLHIEPTLETDFAPPLSSRGIKRLRLHEHSVPACSTDVFSQASQEQDYSNQNSNLGGKRQRLNLPDQNPNHLSAGTQTQSWLDMPERSNIFSQTSAHVPSSNVQGSLVDNKESSVILNGDDHSENSEGSASTSGCSSLVSHKDRINCMSSIMLSESDIKGRRDAASPKGKISGDISSNRLSLWSSGTSSAVRSVRSPTVMQTNQPGFSLSAFIGSSQPSERKVASPFYQGKTTYGGASASRRMPPAAAPYQVDKPLRNQIKYRSNESKDSYEGMSSAARRILQTLEKMSSPVTDAKKIPNTNKSPIDLSLYLMPPKHRRNLQSTPAGPSKGPPIADISTISKLTTIKSYGQKRFQNSILDSPSLLSEKTSSILNVLPQILQSSPEMPSLPSGGGKMRNKLHQQHQPAAKSKFSANAKEMESRTSDDYVDTMPDPIDLPDVPLPITTLPTIAFGPTSVRNACDSNAAEKDFVFSNPIEHVVPNSELSNSVVSSMFSPFTTQTDVNRSISVNNFTFSNPIELENPITSVPPTSNAQSNLNFTSKSSEKTWECSSCWVRNPDSVTKCKCCENPREVPKTSIAPVSSSNAFKPSPATPKTSSNDEPQKPISSALPVSTTGLSSTTAKSAASWSCSSCWVSNPADKEKCVCCEAPCPSKGKTTGGSSNKESGSTKSSSSSTFGCSNIPVSLNSQSGFNFSGLSKVPQVSSTWECDACLVRNEMDKQKCAACETLRPNKNNLSNLSEMDVKKAQQQLAEFSEYRALLLDSKNGGYTVNQTAIRLVNAQIESVRETLKFSSPGFSFKSTSETKPNATLSFNSTSNAGFKFNVSSTTSTTSTGFTLSTSVKPSADGFIFVNKNDPATSSSASATPASTSTFTFGSATLSSAKSLTTASESKAASTADVPFKFGAQTVAASSPATSVGTPNNLFPFGAKSEATNSPKPAVSSENPASSLASASPQLIFGSSVFGKQTPGETKGATTAASKAFQFGSAVSSAESSWECSKCHSKNNGEKDKCSSCNAAKIDKTAESNSAPTVGISWECASCRAKNMEDKEKCTSCGQNKRSPDFSFKGAGDVKSKNDVISLSAPSTNNASSPFTFGATASSSPTSAVTTASLMTNTVTSLSSTTTAASISLTSAVSSTTAATTGFSFGSTTSAPSTGPFVFGAKSDPVTTTSSVFKFGSGTLSTSKPSTTGFENSLTPSAAPLQFGKPSVATTTAPASFGTASNSFTFGIKTEPANSLKPTVSLSQTPAPAFGTTPSQSVFGGAVGNAMTAFGNQTSGGLNLSSSAVSKTNPLFQFGTPAPSAEASWECSSCRMKNNSDKTTCASCGTLQPGKSISGFTFKGANDMNSSTGGLGFKTVSSSSAPTSGFTFNAAAPSTTTAATTAFAFSTATPGNFVFGAKSDTATTTTTPSFKFGSAPAATAKPSITGFENNLSSAPVAPFQFGNQPAIAASTPAVGGFGGATSNTFTFGNKSDNSTLQPAATSSQMPAPAFGSTPTQPMFGNATSTPSFGKQAPAGFNFNLPASSNSTPVFPFGAEKKQATQSGFAFGTPSQDNMSQNFPAPFNISTPPSFNFSGNTSSTGQCFQFAANSDSTQTTSSSGPRKIRKALRRMK